MIIIINSNSVAVERQSFWSLSANKGLQMKTNVWLWLRVMWLSLWSVHTGGRSVCPSGPLLALALCLERATETIAGSKRATWFLQPPFDGVFSGTLLLLMCFFGVNLHAEGTGTVLLAATFEIHSLGIFCTAPPKRHLYTLIFEDKNVRS